MKLLPVIVISSANVQLLWKYEIFMAIQFDTRRVSFHAYMHHCYLPLVPETTMWNRRWDRGRRFTVQKHRDLVTPHGVTERGQQQLK